MPKHKHELTVGDIVQARRAAVSILRDKHTSILLASIKNPRLTSAQVRKRDCVLHVLIDALNHLEGRGIAIPGLYARQLFEEV